MHRDGCFHTYISTLAYAQVCRCVSLHTTNCKKVAAAYAAAVDTSTNSCSAVNRAAHSGIQQPTRPLPADLWLYRRPMASGVSHGLWYGLWFIPRPMTQIAWPLACNTTHGLGMAHGAWPGHLLYTALELYMPCPMADLDYSAAAADVPEFSCEPGQQ